MRRLLASLCLKNKSVAPESAITVVDVHDVLSVDVLLSVGTRLRRAFLYDKVCLFKF